MDCANITLKIKDFLERETKRTIPDVSTNLITSGFLDSFTIIKLITFIESDFNVNIDLDSTDEESFSSLEKLAEQVIKWQNKK